jgi:TonB family protein
VAERPVKAKPDNNGHDQINLDELLDVARYKKSWKDNIDRRFVSIFLVSLFFNIILVMYLSHLPLEITTEYARKIQEHYARFIYEKEPEPAEEETQQPEMLGMEEGAKKEQAKAGAGKGEAGPGKGAGEPAGQAAARARREAHRKSTQEIAQEVSSKGVLGLLTGTGSAARGEEVADILGELGGGASENLDEVLSGISGIKSSGQPSGGKGRGKGGARGSRVTGGGGGIGDMVAALTQAQTREVGKRTQKLVVSQSSVKAEGGKSAGRRPEDVLAVINSHRAAIEYCYQRALRRNPNLRGKISVRFVIRPDGSVKDVKIISSTLNDPRVERCIVAKIRSWRDFGPIDPSKGDAVFRQDFIFGY